MNNETATKNCLPFNPVSDSYHTLNNGYPIDISPEMARYILVNHNGENRPISVSYTHLTLPTKAKV